MKKVYYFIFVFILSFLQVHAQEKHFQMGAEYLSFDNKDYLAISFKNEKGWHSYWKNPGDAGLPVIIKFNEIKSTEIKELNWPAPHTYLQEDILSYGYSDKYTFFYELNSSAKRKLQNSPQEVQSQILICNQICIPGSESIKIRLGKNNQFKILSSSSPRDFELSREQLIVKLNALPKKSKAPKSLIVNFARMGEELFIHSTFPKKLISKLKSDSNFITPYPNNLLGLMKEELFIDEQSQMIHSLIKVDWEGEYAQPPRNIKDIEQAKISFDIEYLLQQDDHFIKTKSKINRLINYAKNELSKIRSLTKFNSASTKSSKSFQSSSQSIWLIILFALIGGLILNLMPCVLPVISIKLFGLINSRVESDKSRLLKHNLTYTLGVLSTFGVLAIIVHLIRSSGEQIGWGFQLQSPSFVFFMILVIFLMGLNMLGLFEFKTPGGNKLGGTNLKESFLGDFFSGVISTILSTPCSAPFLGSALTFAFTTSTFNIYLVFLCVGLGLSLPFILIGFFPKLISFLPKPGMWMQKLKYFLGLALILTAAWLISVFFSLTQSSTALIATLLILGCILGSFLVNKILKKKALSISLLVITVLGTLTFFQQGLHKVSERRLTSTINDNWKSWSPQVMKTNSIKFVNFTAQWCLTCKVNKKLILDRENFYQFAKENKVELFEADWTRRDEVITKWLASYQVVGVPAYFVQNTKGKIIYLGETTSIDEIARILKSETP